MCLEPKRIDFRYSKRIYIIHIELLPERHLIPGLFGCGNSDALLKLTNCIVIIRDRIQCIKKD